jgi:hypothetical protein
MFPTQSDLKNRIILNLNGYIDPWLSTLLVHHLYLKSMEGHLFQVVVLAGAVDVLHRGFTT